MVSLAQFAKNMDRRADRLVTNATHVKQRVARHVLTAVVMQTPHDTGRARYNWNVAMNFPNRDYSYSSFNDYARTGDWLGKMATSRAAILRATEKDVIYISNGLPYIGKLNRGYSAQGPRDYVRTSAIAGARVVSQSKILR